MDPRIREHAETVVQHSTDVRAGDHVAILAPPAAEDFVVALYEACGERNATPLWIGLSSRAVRAKMRAAEPDSFAVAEHLKGALENTDVLISVRASRNASERSDVDPDTTAAYVKAQQPLQKLYRQKRWCGTQFPTPGNAQLAEMSTEAYEEFVWDAVNKDWEAQHIHQQQLVKILDPAEEVRIVSGDTTDISMSIAGMVAVNDDGKKNLPGGEVFTTPIPDSVKGTVLFDKPLIRQGREIQDAYLQFEDGEVVEFDASRNVELLESILNTDEGARRLGELGIGMNRDIDRFTRNMLFDEKMGDTIHLALGQSIDESVPEEMEGNESATHLDMIVDMSENSIIEIDGEVVQRDGTFVFEDGFEA